MRLFIAPALRARMNLKRAWERRVGRVLPAANQVFFCPSATSPFKIDSLTTAPRLCDNLKCGGRVRRIVLIHGGFVVSFVSPQLRREK